MIPALLALTIMTRVLATEPVQRLYVDGEPSSLSDISGMVQPGDVIVSRATGHHWTAKSDWSITSGVGDAGAQGPVGPQGPLGPQGPQGPPGDAGVHSHPISDVEDLQASLDAKSDDGHAHLVADVTGLQVALDAKADESHGHAIGDTVGLQTALDAKAATSHGHAQSDVTGLEAALVGKSDVGHTHAISAVTGLQAALDGKSATGHGHAIGDTTGLQTALDGKEPANANLQAHVAAAHAPSNAQKNSDITKAEIEAKLTGEISSHTHAGGPGGEAFPVGSVFIAVVATNPGTLLGYGTWAAFAAGRVLVGLDAGQTEFDTLLETGGAKTVTLTEAQMPAHTHVQDPHTHSFLPRSGTTGSVSSIVTGTLDTSSTISGSNQPHIQAATATNQNTGGGGAHNNLQPYIVVHIWERTA